MSQSKNTNITEENDKLSDNPVIDYLKKRHKYKDRATLARLREGLREKDGRAMEMYPFIGRFLSEKSKPSYENAVFMVAALFAYYPTAKDTTDNLGASLRKYQQETKSDSVEKRFVALLNAEAEDLPTYLRQIIGLLKSKDIGVNWEQIFDGIQSWNSDKRFVQRKWAFGFWGSSVNDNQTEQQTQNTSGGETE